MLACESKDQGCDWFRVAVDLDVAANKLDCVLGSGDAVVVIRVPHAEKGVAVPETCA